MPRQVIPTFYPPLTDRVSRGMFTALHQIIKMRVLPSLAQLFQNPKLDKDLRKMLREWFTEFCTDGEGLRRGGRSEGRAGVNVCAEVCADRAWRVQIV